MLQSSSNDAVSDDAENVWTDESPPSPRQRFTRQRADVPARLMTAADLAGEGHTWDSTAQPKDYRPGTLVKHPEYGLGKVVSVSDTGSEPVATVQFFTPVSLRSFHLRHSTLRPVRSGR
jgi:hypothetical protein